MTEGEVEGVPTLSPKVMEESMVMAPRKTVFMLGAGEAPFEL